MSRKQRVALINRLEKEWVRLYDAHKACKDEVRAGLLEAALGGVERALSSLRAM